MKSKEKEERNGKIDLFGDRLDLLRCLFAEKAKVEIILQNGFFFAGFLARPPAEDKIRTKTKGELDDLSDRGIYVDTWPREIAAIKFETTKSFKNLFFKPYQGKQPSYSSTPPLDSDEHASYEDTYELLVFFLEGKRQGSVRQVEVVLVGGNTFKGALEIVDKNRVLLALEESTKSKNVYLDLHPLMISAVQFEIGSAGWPYDPTAC